MSTQTGEAVKPKSKHRWIRWVFPISGLLALIWFLVRVIPKPSRAVYPCQRVAAPLASGFIVWLLGILGSIAAFHKAKRLFRKSHFAVAIACLVIGVAAIYWPLSMSSKWAWPADPTWYEPNDPPNDPCGVARGINPGRVVWAYDSSATSWDGATGYWWESDSTNQTVVSDMISNAICDLAGDDVNESEAWDKLFKHFNQAQGKGNTGYQAGEKIAIKILCIHDHFNNTNDCTASPQVCLSLLRQLVNNAGVDEDCITFYDATMLIPESIFTPCKAEFPDVNFVDWTGGDDREQYVRNTNAQVHWSDDLENPTEPYGGYPTYLPTCVTDANYIINLANLKGHSLAGITVCAKNHFGSICADSDYGQPLGPYRGAPKAAGVHPYIAVHDFELGNPDWACYKRDMGTYNALVDLMGHKDVGEKTVLFLVDGLYAVNYQGCLVSNDTKWQSAPFYNDWTSSIFVSQDGVAIESVALDFLRSEPVIQTQSNPEVMGAGDTVDNFLHEAALADNPPSGTFYDPEADGNNLPSLGVHEHWKEPVKKQYTRNLKIGDGIELIRSPRVWGDINSGGVDYEDLVFIVDNWATQNCNEANGWCDGADIDKDEKVNFTDYAIFAGDWLKNIIQ